MDIYFNSSTKLAVETGSSTGFGFVYPPILSLVIALVAAFIFGQSRVYIGHNNLGS